ncbi:MAG: uracil-DNA glycosylase [Treponema sp.]|jgi:DNA polymerase|nr:uracil-DNA glycosylase [Treponema sp.]
MTADEKTSLARFLDIAADSLTGGYRSEKREYQFTDDAEPVESCSLHSEKSAESLEKIAADIRSCTACPLCTTRKNTVPGEGAAEPLVMVIGEGPGEEEDASGRPFVGKAGQLLDRMLDATGLSRERNCFIANVVKCRPPFNREPAPEETAACAVFLERQIRLLKPRFILCTGKTAAQNLLKTKDGIGRLRGRFMELHITDGMIIPLIATYHPSALLRNEEYKRPAWEDLKLLKARLEATGN